MIASAEIYCEGYHDRDFIAGWLESRGWRDPGKRAGGSRRAVKNPITGSTVAGGRFGFMSATDTVFAEIVHCRGDSRVFSDVEQRLRELPTKPLDHLILVTDLDTDCNAAGEPNLTAFRASVLSLCRKIDASCSWNADGSIVVLGKTRLFAICWHCAGPSMAGVPDKNTLERIVCASLASAYGDRATAVATWLASRPGVSATGPKAFSWSFMAGWWAEEGCTEFFRSIWRDSTVTPHLESRLNACGASNAIESLEQV